MSPRIFDIFDTRDTKPRFFPALILLAITQIVDITLVVNALRGANPNTITHTASNPFALRCAVILLTVCFAGIVCVLIRTFFEQLRYNPYSYNTIYYAGFALFFLFVTITHAFEIVRSFTTPEMFTIYQVFSDVLYSARTYLFLSFPFIFAYSVALCISNVALIKYEGFRPVNLLGIITSFVIIAANIALFLLSYHLSGSLEQVRLYDTLLNVFAALGLYVECMIIGTMIANAIVVTYEPAKDKDYLIVLGCGMRRDGTPTPLLAGRIDRALRFWQQQQEQSGKVATFVTSGGQGGDEIIPESTCMKNYLVDHGVPEDKVIEENRSTGTLENMRFSKELIDSTSLPSNQARIAFSTTNYHVFRSGLCARRVKMRAVGMGAHTKWWFWPNAAVREFVGILTEHRGKQALILGSMSLGYALLTYLLYTIE